MAVRAWKPHNHRPYCCSVFLSTDIVRLAKEQNVSALIQKHAGNRQHIQVNSYCLCGQVNCKMLQIISQIKSVSHQFLLSEITPVLAVRIFRFTISVYFDVHLPCWCIKGSADKVCFINQSRQLRPFYSLFQVPVSPNPVKVYIVYWPLSTA